VEAKYVSESRIKAIPYLIVTAKYSLAW